MRPNTFATSPNQKISRRKAQELLKPGKPFFVADVIAMVKGDSLFPASRRASTLSSLTQLPE